MQTQRKISACDRSHYCCLFSPPCAPHVTLALLSPLSPYPAECDLSNYFLPPLSPLPAGIGEFLFPPQDISTEVIVGEVDKEITFGDFNLSLLKGEV